MKKLIPYWPIVAGIIALALLGLSIKVGWDDFALYENGELNTSAVIVLLALITSSSIFALAASRFNTEKLGGLPGLQWIGYFWSYFDRPPDYWNAQFGARCGTKLFCWTGHR